MFNKMIKLIVLIIIDFNLSIIVSLPNLIMNVIIRPVYYFLKITMSKINIMAMIVEFYKTTFTIITRVITNSLKVIWALFNLMPHTDEIYEQLTIPNLYMAIKLLIFLGFVAILTHLLMECVIRNKKSKISKRKVIKKIKNFILYANYEYNIFRMQVKQVWIRIRQRKELNIKNESDTEMIDESEIKIDTPCKDTSLLCVICFDKRKCILMMPCYHLSLCFECAVDYKNIMKRKPKHCPMCRQKIDNMIKVFM